MDLRGNIPTFIGIRDGKVHDVNMLDEIVPEAGAIYVMDRGSIDIGRLLGSLSVQRLCWFSLKWREGVRR